MKSKIIKGIAIAVSTIMLALATVGCGGTKQTDDKASTATVVSSTTAQTTQQDPNKPDISKKVELQFYMVGDAPKDLQLISDEVNKITDKDLNCTVIFNYTTWTDLPTKYNLLLTSGQNIDLLYSASWLDYAKFAKKGAFKDLTDLMPKYAPDLNKFVTPEYWNGVKVDNKIYMIPNTLKSYAQDGFAYREDLRKKYNLPEINSIETVEAYLDGVKKNDPSQPLLNEINAVAVFNSKYKMTTWMGTEYGLMSLYDNPSTLNNYFESPDFVADMTVMKRWSDKGFWSKNILTSKDNGNDVFESGKTAGVLWGENPDRFAAAVAKTALAYPDRELKYWAYPDAVSLAIPTAPTNGGYSIPDASQNPERALMFYQKLVLDKNLNHLTEYGIEGTHYKVSSDGHYEMIGDSKTNGFPREAMNGWAWRNPDFMLYDKSYDQVDALNKHFDTISKPDIAGAFSFDTFPVASEVAAFNNVKAQYQVPLQVGMIKSTDTVESAIKNFLEKAKAAGLDKIQAEYTKQWQAYCTQYGYK